jgi:hypothetical protein
MGFWRVAQRLGRAAASYSEAISRYHADSRSEGAPKRFSTLAKSKGVDALPGLQISELFGRAPTRFRAGKFSQNIAIGFTGEPFGICNDATVSMNSPWMRGYAQKLFLPKGFFGADSRHFTVPTTAHRQLLNCYGEARGSRAARVFHR